LIARAGEQRMGAVGVWGTGPFENDDARDFTAELQADGMWVLRGALEEVALLDPEGYMAAPPSSRAIAAAEVLAAARGKPAPDLPPEVADWMSRAPRIDDRLVALASKAIARILDGSELKELWHASEEGPAWESRVTDLAERLGLSNFR
jgi:hypothetical protein